MSERLPAASLDPNQPGLEAAARAARYRFFAQLLQSPDDALLLAHHSEDQAETVLLRLLQGRGVLPMPAERALPRGHLYRPLLQLPRASLAGYAQAQGLNWIEDPSNRTTAPDRNYLRHMVWPQLRERWPEAGRRLQRAAAQVGQSQDALAFVLAGRTTLPLSWCEQPFAVALLRAWLAGVGEYGATDRALGEFVEQLQAAPERTPSLTLDAGSLVRHGDEVCYEPRS